MSSMLHTQHLPHMHYFLHTHTHTLYSVSFTAYILHRCFQLVKSSSYFIYRLSQMVVLYSSGMEHRCYMRIEVLGHMQRCVMFFVLVRAVVPIQDSLLIFCEWSLHIPTQVVLSWYLWMSVFLQQQFYHLFLQYRSQVYVHMTYHKAYIQ